MDYKGSTMGIPNTEPINYMDWGCTGEDFGALSNFFHHEWDLPMEDVVDLPNDWTGLGGPIPSEIGLSDQPLFQPLNTFIGKDQKLLQKYVKDDNHSPEESVVIQTPNYSTEDDTACSDDSPPLKYKVDFPTKPRSKRTRKPCVNLWVRLLPLVITTKTKPNSSNQNKRRKVECKELENNYWQPIANKKCSHCEVTKTPQWRKGPLGPKTLCNACGVRYRSGRLLPEYRPAASPTFVPYFHSNSHRKVIAMRKKGEQLHHVRIDEEPNFYPMVENPLRSWNILDFQY